MVERLIAYCGLICSECPGYIATQKDDDAERRKVAQTWSEQYGHEIKPEDINCDGCRSEGSRHLGYCNICEIRLCGIERGVVNCAFCMDYPCEKLEKFFKMAPEAKATLDGFKEGRG
ncbi:MAG: DUF3795 domain-containing protein [bacterium]